MSPYSCFLSLAPKLSGLAYLLSNGSSFIHFRSKPAALNGKWSLSILSNEGIVFTCAYSSTCTDNSTYLYEERHRQIGTLELKPVDIHTKLLKTRRYP